MQEAAIALMKLRHGFSWKQPSPMKKNSQKDRLQSLATRTRTAKILSRGVFRIPIRKNDDTRNYEELFMADALSIPDKLTRSGRLR